MVNYRYYKTLFCGARAEKGGGERSEREVKGEVKAEAKAEVKGREGNDVVVLPRSAKPWRPTWMKDGWGVAHPAYGIITLSEGRNSESRAHAVSVVLNRIYGVESTKETVQYLRAEQLINE